MKKTTKKSIDIIILFGLISIFIMYIIIPFINPWIINQSVLINFIVFYFLIFIILSGILLLALNNKKGKRNYSHAIRLSIGFTLIIMAIDLILPSYAVDVSGNLLTSQSIGYFGSVDYAVATFWQSLGISGTLLYFFTYIITGIIFFAVALSLLGSKNFLTDLKNAL